MPSALSLLQEWAADSEDKQHILKMRSGLALRWLNQGQLRFSEKAKCLRGLWSPSIGGTGNIDLPDDFIYEFPDQVKRSAGDRTFLKKFDYQVALNASFSGLIGYSIHEGKLYVWSPQSCSPTIRYVRKPVAITDLTKDDLEIPTEFHQDLEPFLEAKFLYGRNKMSYSDYLMLMNVFEKKAADDGVSWRNRNDAETMMR